MNPSVHTDDARFLELLERWLTGDFNRLDERELYALTAKDAFRKEAWEGFAALPGEAHTAQLERLRQQLLQKRPGKRIPIGMWMAAAAALLLLFGVVYFFPVGNTPERGQTANADAPRADTIDPLAGVEREADLALQDNAAAPSTTGGAGQFAAPAKPEAYEADLAYAKEEPLQEMTSPVTDGVRLGESASGELKSSSPPLASVLEPKIQTPAKVPVDSGPAANSNINKDAADIAVATPVTADEEMVEPPPPAVEEEPAAYGQRAAKKRTQPGKATAAAEPVGGWKNFHSTIRQRARLTAAARNNNISGKVRLQFTVDPKGKPRNVLVLQKLGYGCDEEAMRLIRMFNWVPPGREPVVVEIPFVR